MTVLRSTRALLLCGAALAGGSPALAQTAATTDPAAVPPPVAATAAGKQIYTPADFARFAPKTAYDMLAQVPGFSIRSADQERGLGQASENVLINGQRIANKSGGALDELQRVPADSVERIEILDAASLGIAGLSGQVANVMLKANQKSSGQFVWNPNFRPHYAKPNLFGGSVSYSGKKGPLDYTLSVANDPGRGGFGGPILIYDRNGVLTETRHETFNSEYDRAKFQAKFGLDGPGTSAGNLTLAYVPYWNPTRIRDRRELVTGELRSRTNLTKLNGYFADINGDYAFNLGPGKLKLIGVRHWEHEPLLVTQILNFDSTGADAQGIRFARDTRLGETIGRGEYGWKSGRNDWQISLERAYNSLDQKGGLAELDPDGEFQDIPFPEGTGKVTETRYEAIGTLSRPLASNLNLQIAGGAEISKLDLDVDDQPARKFFRPKGSVTLGWQPSKGWDISFKARRRVGQISFYDFLAQPRLSEDRENAGNPNLVPPQSWEAETEFARELGVWGKTRLKLHYYKVEDIIDVIPIGENGEGIGNLPSATRFGFESVSTINFDPIGWKGAKLDLTVGRERTAVRDPLTGDKRQISGVRSKWFFTQLRHDIPGTQIAWSAYADYGRFAKYYYLTEVFRSWEGPWFVGAYVEHKNVHGMTVRLSVDNLLNGRHFFSRTVYSGYRDREPINFIQKQDQLIGPIISLRVKGTF
jgi:outer membrane receptor for ferrienterochelin and colicins